jgi:hypothetical protein
MLDQVEVVNNAGKEKRDSIKDLKHKAEVFERYFKESLDAKTVIYMPEDVEMAEKCLNEGKELIKEYLSLLSFDSFAVSPIFAKINSCVDGIIAKCQSQAFVVQHMKEVHENYDRGVAKPGDSAFSPFTTNKKSKTSDANKAKRKRGKAVQKVRSIIKSAKKYAQKLPAHVQAMSSFDGNVPSGNSPSYGSLSAAEIDELDAMSKRFSEIFSTSLNECNQSASAILLVSSGDLKLNSHKLKNDLKNPAARTNDKTHELLASTLQKMYAQSTSKQR